MNSVPAIDLSNPAISGRVRIYENPVGDLSEYFSPLGKMDMTVLLILNGSFECAVNRSNFFISPYTLAILPEVSFIRRVETSEDFKGYLITIDKPFVDRLQIPQNSMMAWRKNNEMVVKRISKNDVKAFKLYINLLQDNLADESCTESNRDEVEWLLAKAFCFKILGKFGRQTAETVPDENYSRKDAISKEFIKLVQENCITHRDLSFYADKLCITPKYLSSVISKTTGKKALKWIEDYVIVQAMQLLKSTDMNINQISDALNFQTPSDFCRCFRKNTGISPRQYRTTA